jgi:hypothetical protein
MRVAVCQNRRLLYEGLTRTLGPMTAEPSNVQINDRPATSNWQVTKTTSVAAMHAIGVVATIWATGTRRLASDRQVHDLAAQRYLLEHEPGARR